MQSVEEPRSTVPDSGIDRPGIVQLLKPPTDGTIIQVVSDEKFKEIQREKDKSSYSIFANTIYDKDARIIYLLGVTRSALALDATLRELQNICKVFEIPELIIIREKKRDANCKSVFEIKR